MQTKLHAWHLKAGARMVDFGGWDMPIQYETGPREEHLRVRSFAGLFDIDHMGRFEITGPGTLVFLQLVQTWDASRIAEGRAHYSLLCSESGGIIDDIFLYHLPRSWLMIVNASNTPKDLAWLQSRARGFDVKIRDAGADTCMLALQGPGARDILKPLCSGVDPAAMGFHRVVECGIDGSRAILCTTGYTGEPGFEMLLPAARAEVLWEKILLEDRAAGLIPCGLAARDSLRAEACLPLYGHEIDETTDPFTAGLARAAVCMDGHDFVGRAALAAVSSAPLPRQMVGFEMVDAGVPRQGYAIQAAGCAPGRVTTGLASPSTGRFVGMGYVESACAETGSAVRIVIRDTEKAARIVARPFYTSPHWR
ncbi:MAG TPA: glycine cleavage system aminomethyltransferase GcvT [Spirochaetia bacterium]|nr:glycine cleavage system aminomethyltransferase GcvT [Spirochaetia bacterium]